MPALYPPGTITTALRKSEKGKILKGLLGGMAVREPAPVGPKSWLSWRHLAVKFPNDKIDLETEKLSHLSILSEGHRLKVGS